MKLVFMRIPLQCFFAGFAGADPYDLLQVVYEDLAVTNLAGASRAFDRFNCTLNDRVVNRCLDFCLWQEVDHILGTAIQLGVTFLAPEPLDLGDGDALHTDGREGFAHFIELERLNDGSDEFHVSRVRGLSEGFGDGDDAFGAAEVAGIVEIPQRLTRIGTCGRECAGKTATKVFGQTNLPIRIVICGGRR